MVIVQYWGINLRLMFFIWETMLPFLVAKMLKVWLQKWLKFIAAKMMTGSITRWYATPSARYSNHLMMSLLFDGFAPSSLVEGFYQEIISVLMVCVMFSLFLMWISLLHLYELVILTLLFKILQVLLLVFEWTFGYLVFCSLLSSDLYFHIFRYVLRSFKLSQTYGSSIRYLYLHYLYQISGCDSRFFLLSLRSAPAPIFPWLRHCWQPAHPATSSWAPRQHATRIPWALCPNPDATSAGDHPPRCLQVTWVTRNPRSRQGKVLTK